MRLITSIGDCNGIGLEVFFKAIEIFDRINKNPEVIDITLAGKLDAVREYAGLINYPITVNSESFQINNRLIRVLECSTETKIDPGKIKKDSGQLSAESIQLAITKTLAGQFDALLTLPVSKTALYLAGWKYPGHTEMLAAACRTEKQIMILCSKDLRVTPVTVHIEFKKVPSALSQYKIQDVIEVFHKSLIYDFGINNPKIAILSLNPHGGESGTMGTEEIDIIQPAMNKMKADGIITHGPYPADGFFAHRAYRQYDGVIAMYHDQGLIPIKLLSEEGGVNFTGGLPIIRTSPDHGTAFDMAGKNQANPKSTLEAIEMSLNIYNNRKNSSKEINIPINI